MLVLVVDQGQIQHPWESIARVCRDYDVDTIDELVDDLRVAVEQAGNQARLRQAMLDVITRFR